MIFIENQFKKSRFERDFLMLRQAEIENTVDIKRLEKCEILIRK